MSKLTPTKLKKIARTFEQDTGDLSDGLDYYVGIANPVINEISHPLHLYELLTSARWIAESGDMTEEQMEFIVHFFDKWIDEIEEYCPDML